MAIARNDEALVLYPATIALATNGVISDPAPPAGVPVQGVPLGIFKEVTRANDTFAAAVKVLVDPPLDTGQYVEITLWLNGVQYGPAQSVVDEIMTFDLFQSDLRDNVINVIQYKLKNHAGNISESTELWALYSATLPGGNNVPGTGEHPALAISLPAELGNPASIGKDEVDKGVLITFDYPYRKAHDTITYEINRERFTYTVKPDELEKPVSVLIDRAKFEMIGSLENCPFSYTVVDQLLNATHQRRWSKSIYANIDIDRVTLEKPILREDPDDDMDDPTIVDLDKLQGRALLAVIIPQAPTFQKDDDVFLTYRSSASDVDLSIPGKITANFGVLQPCIISVPNDRVIADSDLEVFFELSRPDGKLVGQSKTATATVVGTRIELEPPSIKEASGNVLDPFAAKDTLTAIVPAYDDMIGTQVSVTWTGTPGEGSVTVGPVNVTAQMDKEVTLPNTVVAFNLGKAVKLIYTVMRNGVPQDSKELSLSVLSIVDGDSRLSVPTIGGEAGNELDVTQLAESAQLAVAKWALQVLGQCIWLYYEGTDKNGDPVSKVFWAGEAHQQAEGLTTAAQVSWLRELKDAKPLVITFKVNFDKVPNVNTAIAFPVKTYAIKAGPPPVLEFINAPYESITGEKLDPVIIRLTREELPEANATISLTLPPGFTYSDGSSGRRDFTTDAYGQISVTDIEVPDEEGEHLFQAASPGAIQTTAQVVILSPGPVGSIELLGGQYSIAITHDGARVFADLEHTIAVIDTNTHNIVGLIRKPQNHSDWGKILVHPNNKRIYTAQRAGFIAIYDTETNQFVKYITSSTRYAIMSRDGARLTYLDLDGPIRTIDTNTEQTIGKIFYIENTRPMSYNIDGSIVYTVTQTAPNEFLFQARDVITAQQKAQYRFTHSAPQTALFECFLSIDGEHVYLDIAYGGNNEPWTKSLIVQLSSTTLQEQKRISVPDYSIMAQISPDQIYLANFESTAFAVLEIKSGQIIKHIEVGHRPATRSGNVSAVYTPDEKRLYVANRGGPLAVVRTNR